MKGGVGVGVEGASIRSIRHVMEKARGWRYEDGAYVVYSRIGYMGCMYILDITCACKAGLVNGV